MTAINSDKKTLLLTGATSGIGLALADRLKDKYNLILSGRKTKDEAQILLPKHQQYIQADFQNPSTATDNIANSLNNISLDHAVLCHGTGYYKQPDDEDIDLIIETLNVNLLSSILLSQKLFPHLKQKSGCLTLIGSIAHKGAAKMPTYAASKAGLDSFARSLKAEWEGQVSVQIIHPGPTHTPMHSKAGYQPGPEGFIFLSPEIVANEIERLLITRKTPATIFLMAKLKSLFMPKQTKRPLS